MSTGLETWNQSILEIGPAYPFVGTETMLAIIGLVTWLIWHIVQIKSENKTIEEEKKVFSDKKKLAAAMKLTKMESLSHRLDGNDL